VLKRQGFRILGSTWQVAMFRKNLRDIAVYPYRSTSRRTIHTIFCPPLRIVALDDRGQSVFDQVVEYWTILKLPACRIILEMNPGVDYHKHLPSILSEAFLGGMG
jgi:hypothetical protein